LQGYASGAHAQTVTFRPSTDCARVTIRGPKAHRPQGKPKTEQGTSFAGRKLTARQSVKIRTLLLALALALPLYAAKDPYEVLGLPKSLLKSLAAEEAQNRIQRAYRILALQFHPDFKGSDETKTEFSEVTEAYDELMAIYRKQKPAPDLRREVVSASSAAISRGMGATGNFFADAFGPLARSLSILGMTEEEYYYNTEVYTIRFGQSDAVYQAVTGNGFGWPSTYEQYPEFEPAFHYFLLAHLDELLFPEDGIGPRVQQIQKLYDGLKLSPHSQLEELLGRWLGLHQAGKTPDRCALGIAFPKVKRISKQKP
jgi:curved DNA-binding protein CbpA